MRALVAIALCASACGSGTYLTVELSGSVGSVDHLSVVVENAGESRSISIDRGFTLPPSQSFVLSFDRSRSGPVKVDLTALLANVVVGRASGMRELVPGKDATLPLVLGSTTDGGTDQKSDGGAALLDHFQVQTTVLTIAEHAPLNLHLIAKDAAGNTLSGYQGTPTLATDWGDVAQQGSPAFAGGEADLIVRLNRETSSPAHSAAHITVTDGTHSGVSPDLTVTAPPWTLISSSPVFIPNTGGWDYYVGNPSWMRVSGTYDLFYFGQSQDNKVSGFALATSPDGDNWTRKNPSAPGFAVSPSGWDQGETATHFRVRFNPATGHFFAAYVNTNPIGLGIATSPDGLTWTRAAQAFGLTIAAPCKGGYNTPMATFIEPGKIHVYDEESDNPCQIVLTSETQTSATWTTLTGIPKEQAQPTFIVQVFKEGSVYKMWYSRDLETTIKYATSSDGVNWVPSPSGVTSLAIQTVLWNEVTGSYEALVQVPYATNYLGFARATRP